MARHKSKKASGEFKKKAAKQPTEYQLARMGKAAKPASPADLIGARGPK